MSKLKEQYNEKLNELSADIFKNVKEMAFLLRDLSDREHKSAVNFKYGALQILQDYAKIIDDSVEDEPETQMLNGC